MKRLLLSFAAFVVVGTTAIAGASAATAIVVTQENPQGWSTADTAPGGAVDFVADAAAPSGVGALRLTTDSSTTAKAQFLHGTNFQLADVSELAYSTKQNSASFAQGDASFQLQVNLNGATGFTTLVFEPYQNTAQGPVVAKAWQQWDVDQGLFWSTRTVSCANGDVNGTAGGPATYTLADIVALCPDASVIQFGVNIGSSNPSYDVEVDLVDFNGTLYDFESPAGTPPPPPPPPPPGNGNCKGGHGKDGDDRRGDHDRGHHGVRGHDDHRGTDRHRR
jgi:hypothetical protein